MRFRGYLRCPDTPDDGLDLREAVFEGFLKNHLQLDGLRQARVRNAHGVNSHVAFIKSGKEFTSHPCRGDGAH